MTEGIGADRATALRNELAELGRRQEQVADELRAIHGMRRDRTDAGDDTVPIR